MVKGAVGVQDYTVQPSPCQRSEVLELPQKSWCVQRQVKPTAHQGCRMVGKVLVFHVARFHPSCSVNPKIMQQQGNRQVEAMEGVCLNMIDAHLQVQAAKQKAKRKPSAEGPSLPFFTWKLKSCQKAA